MFIYLIITQKIMSHGLDNFCEKIHHGNKQGLLGRKNLCSLSHLHPSISSSIFFPLNLIQWHWQSSSQQLKRKFHYSMNYKITFSSYPSILSINRFIPPSFKYDQTTLSLLMASSIIGGSVYAMTFFIDSTSPRSNNMWRK